jgi:hypothetical protein
MHESRIFKLRPSPPIALTMTMPDDPLNINSITGVWPDPVVFRLQCVA